MTDAAATYPGAVPWWGRLAPYADHGPLPALLLGATVVTGVVDAVSYIALGHVFVANMTGNVVLLGFAVAGAPALSLVASVVALAGFLVGAALGGVLGRRKGRHRGALLRTATVAETALLVVALLVAIGPPVDGARRDVVVAALAMAMGGQNAIARRIAVPDLTTTVVTLTLTALATDAPFLGGPGGGGPRRLGAVVAMFAGALAGALLTLHASPAAGLGLAAACAVVVAVGAHAAARSTARWTSPR